MSTIARIAKQIRTAAADFAECQADDIPTTLYVQKFSGNRWEAVFADDNHRDVDMTRWDSGADVEKVFAACVAEDRDAVFDYAGDVSGSWEDAWTVRD